jgi:hypothetical protein
MPDFSLGTTQQVPVTLTFLDDQGTQAPVTNATLTSSDPTVLTVTELVTQPGPAGTFNFTLVATGGAGTSVLTATGTNPDGSVVPGTQNVTAVAPAAPGASQVTFTFGTPTAKV